ncbi:hypothetical protein BBC27_07780 [Acidithiobacillus ferrivorans]|uniref:Uncharacterized protein n=1 Tax=Acidithiobacillus ferrivorans TaxID=160808 RepID=A0A1B9C0L8_9PROT|nr:hypothetical protein [Acidithiobacillus ferrivorans]OCB03453.1 hypothetical protein BBC27_07780 [Acidithiobacillus ferrivorans]
MSDDSALYFAVPGGLRDALADDELPDDRLSVGALWAVERKVAPADGAHAQVGGRRALLPVEILA